MWSEIFRYAAGISSILSLLAFLGALYVWLQSRSQERSIVDDVRGAGIVHAESVVKILGQFSSDDTRLAALQHVLGYDQNRAQGVLDKVTPNVDAREYSLVSYIHLRQRLLVAAIVLLCLAGIAVVGQEMKGEPRLPPSAASTEHDGAAGVNQVGNEGKPIQTAPEIKNPDSQDVQPAAQPAPANPAKEAVTDNGARAVEKPHSQIAAVEELPRESTQRGESQSKPLGTPFMREVKCWGTEYFPKYLHHAEFACEGNKQGVVMNDVSFTILDILESKSRIPQLSVKGTAGGKSFKGVYREGGVISLRSAQCSSFKVTVRSITLGEANGVNVPFTDSVRDDDVDLIFQGSCRP